jgi:hypothetical protein
MKEEKLNLEKARAYMDLSQNMYIQYHQRRSLEWRMHITLWTLLVLFGAFCIEKNLHFKELSLFIFLIIPFHFIWIIRMLSGVIQEQNLSINYRTRAVKILEEFNVQEGNKEAEFLLLPFEEKEWALYPVWAKQFFKGFSGWLSLELGITLLLSLAAFFFSY